MKNLVLAMAIALATAGLAVTHEATAGQIKFEDGSVLHHHADGTCRMIDAHGRKMEMKDGAELEAADGRRFLLMNKKVWVQTGKPGAGSPALRNKCNLTQIASPR
ncbi:MAG: CopK family periplasmic copper-binding protein [Gammaproteobacteria bacterium]|nr:CopK family periplasmic copper-binding protein [Gammaproteobacteria bacterium]